MLKKALILLLLLVGVQFIIRKLFTLQLMKNVFNHTPGPCRIVPGTGIGYEDMETLPNGLTIISSGIVMPTASHRVHDYMKKHDRKGRMFMFDLNNPDKGLEELAISHGNQFDKNDFYPHGVSLWTTETGKVLVLVVNHRSKEDTVEKFELDSKSKTLKHIHTYRDPNIYFLNDVAMDSENSFYFTHYANFRHNLLHFIELFTPLKFGKIIYYDGKEFIEQDNGFVTANGIAVSKDKRFFYMVESLPHKVHVYTRQSNGTLSRLQEVDIMTSGDNPTFDEDGNIFIGAHPIGWKVLLHLEDPVNPAPSQVIKLHLKNGQVTKITEVLMDDGHTLYGSTVASAYKNRMLVGTIQHKLLYCELRWVD